MAKGDKKKAKKGKAKKKQDGEMDKETIAKQAVATAKVWESKYIASEDSRYKYKDNAMKLVDENESLQTSVYKTEQDTIEVIAFLKKEEAQRNAELLSLKQQLKESQVQAVRERDQLVQTFQQKITSLENTLEERNHEVATLQGELELLKEFRSSKAALDKEIADLKETIQQMELNYKKTSSRMQERFLEEKHQLQKEANRQVTDLAKKAHEMAVKNLDQKTRTIYRENVQLTEALSLHLKDADEMKKMLNRIRTENGELKYTEQFDKDMLHKLVSEATKHKKVIKELHSKVQSLETSLSKMVTDLEEEKHRLVKKYNDETSQLQCEVLVLRRNAQLQAKETNHVKLLARQLLDQRSDVEEFFITALNEVRQNARVTQSHYRQVAQDTYQKRVTEASKGLEEYPQVRTFRDLPNSTNSVYNDLRQARDWDPRFENQLDLADLTWEQKEQVLRGLFAMMNGKAKIQSPKKLSPKTAVALPATSLALAQKS